MAMVLDGVVPFGRSLDEYVQMFKLTDADLAGTVLGVGDGPASFNAEGTALGYRIMSIDPIYTFTGAEIRSRFEAVVDGIIAQVKASPQDWVWSYHRSPDGLRAQRVRVIDRFLADYAVGQAAGRYRVGELPVLPFAASQFSLALCSHLLFLYSEQFDLDFHLRSIAEMLRVAPEVRIFPLLTLMRERSPHLEPAIAAFTAQGYTVQIQSVPYELQKGGNQMLVIHAR
jgi:hypothetical protein